jgi:hypothetical protein
VFPVFLDKPLDTVDFAATEAATSVQPNRIEPEPGFHVLSFDVDMRWFTAVAGVKEEPVWPLDWYGWHSCKSSMLCAKDYRRMRVALQLVPPTGSNSKCSAASTTQSA